MQFNADKIFKTFGFIIEPLDSILTYLFVSRNKIKRKIADNIFISPEWTEIEPVPSLKSKKNIQAVLLHINGCWQNSHEEDFRLSDGTIIKPEVKILDEENNEYYLEDKQRGVYPMAPTTEKWIVNSIGYRGKIPQSKHFIKVKVRSDIPFQCSVSWYDYNLK